MTDSSVGCDPGPATGICLLDYEEGRLVGRLLLQADAGSAAIVLRELLYARKDTWTPPNQEPGKPRKLSGSVEKFLTGAGAGSRGKNADVTRQLVVELAEVLELFGYTVSIRAAADVKPWASNKRLVAAGIVRDEKSMHSDLGHAYDGARHALFGAHHAGIVADPLVRVPASRPKIDGRHLN